MKKKLRCCHFDNDGDEIVAAMEHFVEVQRDQYALQLLKPFAHFLILIFTLIHFAFFVMAYLGG